MSVIHGVLRLDCDGVQLHAEVWRPEGGKPGPALLMRTPYGSADAQQGLYAHPSVYAEHGYAVIVQDVRGRWRSGGQFEPFLNEGSDGAAAVGWLAAQRWCDGRIGMYGMSYPGAAQLLAAALCPPALRAIAPAMTASELWSGWFYEHGVLNLSLVPYWAAILAVDTARRSGDTEALAALQALCARPHDIYDSYDRVPSERLLGEAGSRYAPYLEQWLSHPVRDEYWDARAATPGGVPALHIAGWFDVLLTGTLDTHRRMSAQAPAPQHLVIGPWAHEPWSAVVGDRDLGEAAANRINELQLRWFDHWLRDEPLDLPPATVFVLGANRWRQEDAWPPEAVTVGELYLRSSRGANSLSGDGRLSREPPGAERHDRFLHNPRAPVVTVGGRGCSTDNGTIVGPRDQRGQEARNDVLAYDSPPIEHRLLLGGEVRAELYVSRPQTHADYVARLVHVEPDGRTFGITDAVARLASDGRTRSPSAEAAAVGRDVVLLRMTLGHCCVALDPGDRLRLDLCGSSFPRWERNWNGHPPRHAPLGFAEATGLQLVFHDERFPSRILLPILEGGF